MQGSFGISSWTGIDDTYPHKTWDSSFRTGVGRACGRTDKHILQTLDTIMVFWYFTSDLNPCHTLQIQEDTSPVSYFHVTPLPDSSQLFGRTDSITLGMTQTPAYNAVPFHSTSALPWRTHEHQGRQTHTCSPGCLLSRCQSLQHGSPIQGKAAGKIQTQMSMKSKEFWLLVDNVGMGIHML